jgi:uncharacterized protein
MANNYASLAFTDPIKQLQQQYGSRSTYARMEQHTYTDGLTEQEAGFISQRDSFYLASIGENGYPYIQHRGGPKGFIRVIDPYTIGLVDFRGNKQYISVGNIGTHPQVSLIMVDYPHRTRLKIYAEALVAGLHEHPELFDKLAPAGYPHVPERMLLFRISAYDWNCPQHITPRYTVAEIEDTFSAQRTYVQELEAEVGQLKAALAQKNTISN